MYLSKLWNLYLSVIKLYNLLKCYKKQLTNLCVLKKGYVR